MNILDIDDSKLPSFICRKEAANDHSTYWPTYSVAKQNLATELRAHGMAAFWRSRTFLTARAKFILVKVEKPQAADRAQNSKEIAKMKAFVAAHPDIRIVGTKANNLLFRIMR